VADDQERSRMRRSTLGRGAKLATLPIGFAGRTALGVGKRVGGKPAEAVFSEIQRRTADQLFTVLGELKGGAMKLGQGDEHLRVGFCPRSWSRPIATSSPSCRTPLPR
jgi:predicted unusual protein kinase regulating ubiquinone biosynthesis (AarF/ABC1/UbiB family)